jgi:hypothetical protein
MTRQVDDLEPLADGSPSTSVCARAAARRPTSASGAGSAACEQRQLRDVEVVLAAVALDVGALVEVAVDGAAIARAPPR